MYGTNDGKYSIRRANDSVFGTPSDAAVSMRASAESQEGRRSLMHELIELEMREVLAEPNVQTAMLSMYNDDGVMMKAKVPP